jgi:hypothetical protein
MLRVINTATTTAASPAKAKSHVFLVIALYPDRHRPPGPSFLLSPAQLFRAAACETYHISL